jgi:soluble lytic murein transglycosylase-like protein
LNFDPSLILLARQAAQLHRLDEALVCAIVEQESGWNPDAKRFEPAFLQHYIMPLGLPGEVALQRATSWGLMQTMLQSVVEIGYRWDGPTLLQPQVSLEWGCQLFLRKLKRANGDTYKALGYWNGGANPKYPQEVIDRMAKYLPEPVLDAGDL